MKKILTAVLLLLTATVSCQTNINISNAGLDDMEPYIAVNPLNSNFIIAAWMKVTLSPPLTIAVSRSTDGGLTWSAPFTMPHLHPNFTHADVSIAYSGTGTAYISYIDYSTSLDSGYVMVASSVNNGQSWSNPVKVISALEAPDFPIDRPWIAVDRSGGPYNGKIYVVSKSIKSAPLPHHIWMKTSADGGITWSARQQIDSPSTVGLITNSMGTLDAGPDGNVYIAYLSYDTVQNPFPRVLLKKSANGGNTFTQYLIAYPVAGSAITDTLYQGSYCLKVNPANGNNLVFITTDARYGDPDILALNSANGGVNWTSAPVRINDDAQNNGIGQDMCWGGFAPGGTFCAVWRDRRNGGTGSSANFEIYTSASTDGGATFKPNFRISTQFSPPIPIVSGNDFLGVALDNNFLYTDWCDKRTGNTEIFTAKNSLASVVSVAEITKNTGFSLTCYPNPVFSDIKIIINCDAEEQSALLAVYDMQGKAVTILNTGALHKGENQFTVSCPGLAPGNYFIRAETGKKSTEQKFTKVKGN